MTKTIHLDRLEEDCTFTFEGKYFTANGAMISQEYLIAYPADNGVLQDWHGNTIGRYKVISYRPAVFFGHESWIGSRYYYMRARLNDGRCYSLRGFGKGMIAKGKRIKDTTYDTL